MTLSQGQASVADSLASAQAVAASRRGQGPAAVYKTHAPVQSHEMSPEAAQLPTYLPVIPPSSQQGAGSGCEPFVAWQSAFYQPF